MISNPASGTRTLLHIKAAGFARLANFYADFAQFSLCPRRDAGAHFPGCTLIGVTEDAGGSPITALRLFNAIVTAL
jgi:hypothetical protein